MTDDRGALFFIADLESGGAQQVLSQVANRWAADGRRIGVATFSDPAGDFFNLDDRVERLVLGGIKQSSTALQGLSNNLGRVRSVRRALRSFAPKVAIGFIAPMNILLVAASRGMGCRIVISERNDPARQSYGRQWDWLRRRLYPRADLVTANSRGALETLCTFVPGGKLALLPNPLRPFPDPETVGETKRKNVFLNVGRLHEQKGQDLLIRAFAAIADELPDWNLTILGEGSERQTLETLAGEDGISDRVIMPGRVSDPSEHYRSAGVFVMASRWEGAPNVLMEAMWCGLPSVVTDATPGPLELTEPGKTGLVVPQGDIDALAGAMAELARDPSKRAQFGSAAHKRMQPFHIDAVIEEWDRLIWQD